MKICNYCHNPVPEGKLVCEVCLLAISDRQYLEHQRRYIPLIAQDRIKLTTVYKPAGAEPRPQFHIQRFADIRHAWCSTPLPPGLRQDNLTYSEMLTASPHWLTRLCPRCLELLKNMVDSTTESSNAISPDATQTSFIRR